MSGDGDWGPWIEHDGKGCPCVGEYVHREYRFVHYRWRGRKDTVLSGNFAWGIAEDGPSWRWDPDWNPVIRYRIRKPRGMTILENLIADLPAPVPDEVAV